MARSTPACPKEHLVNTATTATSLAHGLDTGNSVLVCNPKTLPIYLYMNADRSVGAGLGTICLVVAGRHWTPCVGLNSPPGVNCFDYV